MKAFALAFLALGLAQSAHASTLSVSGAKAVAIELAMEKAGAQGDAGMGHSWNGISNLACQIVVARQTTASCTVNLLNATDALSASTQLNAVQSKDLVTALTDVGAAQNCIPGGCALEVKSVECQSSLNPEAQDETSDSCIITQ